MKGASRNGMKNQPDVIYTDISLPNSGSSLNHPLSPAGLKSNPNPIIHDEYTLARDLSTGIADVPMVHKAGTHIVWRYYNSWQGVVAAALASAGKVDMNTKKLVTKADIEALFARIPKNELTKPENSTLYYPGDRKSLVFKDEVSVAIVLRMFSASCMRLWRLLESDVRCFRLINESESKPWPALTIQGMNV